MKSDHNILEQEKQKLKRNAFNVPEGYFDSLEDRLSQKIERKNVAATHQKRFLQIAIPAAAAIVVLLASLFIFNRTPQPDPPLFDSQEYSFADQVYSFTGISEYDMINYLENDTLNYFSPQVMSLQVDLVASQDSTGLINYLIADDDISVDFILEM